MMRWAKPATRVLDPQGARLLGRLPETGEVIFAPPGHSSVYGANGSGKSTRVSMPAIMSILSGAPKKSLMTLDVKDGELAAQMVKLIADLGLKVGVIDDLRVRPELDGYRIQLNPFGAIVSAFVRDPRDLVFAFEMLLEALIPEPSNDERNRYFRDWPRKIIEFAIRVLLKRNPKRVTPGSTAAIIASNEMLLTYAQIEFEEDDGPLKDLAEDLIGMSTNDHWPQHVERAKKALSLFGRQTRLEEVGVDATLTHEELIRDGWVVFLVGPQRFMTALGPYFALHILSFCDALYQNVGALAVVADEWTNCPVKPLVSALTTLRAYGGELTMISQSPSEVVRKFGEQEAQTIEDNSITKQWLGFSGFKIAEEISRAMGEQHAVAEALSGQAGGAGAQSSLSLIKQRWRSAAELMAMPPTRMLVHIKGIGFIDLEPIPQNEIDPYCHLLADNPLEGGRLPPNPTVTLATPSRVAA